MILRAGYEFVAGMDRVSYLSMHVFRNSFVYLQCFNLQSQITKLENTVDMCKATGDPHYTTFDGKYVPSLS